MFGEVHIQPFILVDLENVREIIVWFEIYLDIPVFVAREVIIANVLVLRGEIPG